MEQTTYQNLLLEDRDHVAVEDEHRPDLVEEQLRNPVDEKREVGALSVEPVRRVALGRLVEPEGNVCKAEVNVRDSILGEYLGFLRI